MARVVLLMLLLALGVGAHAQTPVIRVEPDTSYVQRDTFVTVMVRCDDNLTGVKGLHFDIDINAAGVVIAPASDESDTTVTLGSLFVEDDTMTFLWDYFWTDSTRLTVDIFVLGENRTVSGPGDLLAIRLNTIAFGESDLVISGIKLRDSENHDVLATVENAWIKVCQFVGDANADNRILVNDLTYMVNFLFRGGPAPTPYAAGDLDCSGQVNISDVTAMVRYLFQGGLIECGLCL